MPETIAESTSLLTSRFNAHMTFNVLSSVQGLIMEKDPEGAIEMISCYSRILRKMLINGRTEIPLKDELESIRDYLEIERIRQDNGFSYAIDVDPAISSVIVPKSLLVSFVENSIKHGVRKLDGDSWIRIGGIKMDKAKGRSGTSAVLTISNLAPAAITGLDAVSGSIHGSELAYGIAEAFFEKTAREVTWETITSSYGTNLVKVDIKIYLP